MPNRLVDVLMAAGGRPGVPAVHLLSGPYVVLDDRRLDVPQASRRLLAYVALAPGQVERRSTAGTLWPDCGDARAAGNLRSALWRLRSCGVDLIRVEDSTLALRPGTPVDVDLVCDWAEAIVDPVPRDVETHGLGWRLPSLDLLPGWYDDWVVFERERVRQLLLHALEVLSRRLAADGRFAEAVTTALTVVRADPLRESAQRALVEAHLAEHNVAEARRAFGEYTRLLARELSVRPGPELTALVERAGRRAADVHV